MQVTKQHIVYVLHFLCPATRPLDPPLTPAIAVVTSAHGAACPSALPQGTLELWPRQNSRLRAYQILDSLAKDSRQNFTMKEVQQWAHVHKVIEQ